jgi:hypothetical protein
LLLVGRRCNNKIPLIPSEFKGESSENVPRIVLGLSREISGQKKSKFEISQELGYGDSKFPKIFGIME